MYPFRLLVASSLLISGCCFANAPTSQLLDFSSPATINLVSKANIKVEAAKSPKGGEAPALRVNYEGNENPSLRFKPATPWNLADAAGLSFTVYNPSEQSTTLLVRLSDGASGDKTALSAVAIVPAATNKTFTIDFSKKFPQPKGVGGRVPEIGPTLYSRYDKFDASAVTSVAFDVDAWTPATTLYLSDVKVIPTGTAITPPPLVTGIVDKYGQFAWNDWAGKIHSDADFALQKKAEAADIAANPPIKGRSRFGGWADGPKLPATGFFTTTKYQGKWSFVDPDGYLFLSMGMNCVTPFVESQLPGRQDLYAWLPPANDPLAFARSTSAGPNGEVVDKEIQTSQMNQYRKYGPQWETEWRKMVERRLPSWGFNTIANWSNSGFQGNSKIPYVATASIKGKYAYVGSMMDPWDPEFAAAAAAEIAPKAEKVKNDPYCLGYFVDNEMPWSYDGDIAIAALKLDAAKSQGKAAFVEQLKAKYATIEALNTAWGTQIASWEALATPNTFSKESLAKMKSDLSDFCKAHALKYFTVVRDTIKATDPNHLYLGCRFAHSSSEAYAACVEICDVVTYNVYQRGINGGEWTWLSDKKPTLVGEFHFGALDSGMFRQGLQSAATQEGRGRLFESYVNSVVNNPKFIGCHWFQYNDQALLGRRDGENFNIGFISVADRPYPEMIAASRRVLKDAYKTRWGDVKPQMP